MGFFISIEGVEGVGKSSVFEAISSHLSDQQCDFIQTREPGGTHIAESIRQILLAKTEEPMLAMTELLLMFASRAQHCDQIIRPALEAGKTVLCDRFVDASVAYQGGGRGLSPALISQLSKNTVSHMPDLTLLLDAPVEIALKRMQLRGQTDRIEQESIDFFERVRQCYLDLAQKEPTRFVLIDASQSKEEVIASSLNAINQLFHGSY